MNYRESIKQYFSYNPLLCKQCGGEMLFDSINYLKDGTMRTKRYLGVKGYIAKCANRIDNYNLNRLFKVDPFGQQSLLTVEEHIEQLMTHYASLIIHEQLTVAIHYEKPVDPPQYETIDIDSISNSTVCLPISKIFKKIKKYLTKPQKFCILSIPGIPNMSFQYVIYLR